MAKRPAGSFKGRHFTSEVILWALRWHLAFPINYRDLASMLADRGVEVDHTTLFRWVQPYAPTLERRIRRHLRPCNGSWRVDETYIKVRGVWTYLYRAVDSVGQTIDFLLSARRNAAAARRFFRKALRQPHTVNPRTITVDKNAAYPSAVTRLKFSGLHSSAGWLALIGLIRLTLGGFLATFDTAGEFPSGSLCHQRTELRAPCRGQLDAAKPFGDPDQVHRRRGCDMLEVGLGLADVARPAQAEAPDGLRDRALDAGPHRAQGSKLGRSSPMPRAHKRHVLLVCAQRQAAPRPRVARAVRQMLARTAV